MQCVRVDLWVTDDGVELVDGLMKELKKLEDKQMLTEPHLTRLIQCSTIHFFQKSF